MLENFNKYINPPPERPLIRIKPPLPVIFPPKTTRHAFGGLCCFGGKYHTRRLFRLMGRSGAAFQRAGGTLGRVRPNVPLGGKSRFARFSAFFCVRLNGLAGGLGGAAFFCSWGVQARPCSARARLYGEYIVQPCLEENRGYALMSRVEENRVRDFLSFFSSG